MNYTGLLLFGLLFLAATVQAGGFLERLAQKKYAGIYQTDGYDENNGQALIYNLEPDGGCSSLFLFPDINPFNPEFSPAINGASCRWEVTHVGSDGITAISHGSEFIRDPLAVNATDGVLGVGGACDPGCFANFLTTWKINTDFKASYIEHFYVTDLNDNPLDTIFTPPGELAAQFLGIVNLTRLERDEVRGFIEDQGVPIVFPPMPEY